MKLRLTTPALHEYREAAEFLIEKNPHAARVFSETMETAFQNLRANPKLGRTTDNPPVRQLVLSNFPYKLFYETRNDTIVILSIFHTSRNPNCR